jgi:tetratricopeptide (TPR) repeat protein
MLDDAVDRLASDELADAPLAHLELLTTIAKTFNHLAKFERGIATADGALELCNEVGDEAVRWKVVALQHKGYAVFSTRSLTEAVVIADEAASLARKELSLDDPFRYEAIELLGIIQMRLQKWEDSLASLQEVYDGKARILGENDPATLTTLLNMGKPMGAIEGRLEEAAEILEKALKGLESQFGREHPLVASTLTHLGDKYERLGNMEEAEALYHESIGINSRVRGPEHRHTLIGRNTLAIFYRDTGAPEKFEQEYRALIPVLKRVLGQSHTTAMANYNFGRFLFDRERFVEAVPYLEDGYEGWATITDPDSIHALRVLSWEAHAKVNAGQLKEALAAYARLDELAAGNPEIPNDFKIKELSRAGDCANGDGKHELAIDYLTRAFAYAWEKDEAQSAANDAIADRIAEVFDSRQVASPDGNFDKQAECWRSGPCRENQQP